MIPKKKPIFLNIRYGLVLGAIAAIFVTIIALDFRERYAVKSIVDEESKRHLAGLVAEEFRMKSRDLTRYARSYCATKNEAFYERYHNILRWSRGEIPRPSRLESSISSRFEGMKISRQEILDKVGLTVEEKRGFQEAESLSNELAQYESQVMESVRRGEIVPGPISPLDGETVPQFVNRVLYGESYHEHLDRIAESTNAFLLQYQLRADALFEDYKNIFSFAILTQLLVHLGLVGLAVFLIQYLVSGMRRQQEENRRLMLDAMPIGCMIRDNQLNLVSCNQEMLRMLGLKDTKDAQEHFSERSPEFQPNGRNSKEYAREMQAKAFQSGFAQFPWVHLNAEGVEFQTEVTLIRISQTGNDFTVAYTRDVSKEEAAARELFNSEARMQAYEEAGNRMRQMLNAIPVGIALFNEKFKLEDCNNVEMKLFGLETKEEYMDQFFNLSPFYQPNGRLSKEMMKEKFASVDEIGVQCFEWVFRRPDGTTFPSEMTITRVQSGDRKTLVACNRDLTEEKAMQAEVIRANERNRLMLDTTPLCCTLLDEEFQGIDCNWEAVKLFGMSNKEEYLANFMNIFPEFQPDGHRSNEFFGEKVKEAFRKGRVTFEGMAQNRQGEEIPIEVVFIPLLLNDTPTVAGYARDLRERKLLEKTEMLSEIKMQFFASMSHEIRTPMNAIVALSGLLMEEMLGEKQRRYVSDIKTSADTLLSLVNDLLDFSKLEAGKMQLVPRHFDFLEMIDHVSSTLTFAAKNKGLDFIQEKNGDLPRFLYGDNVRLKQVLWNLVGNAVKFTEKGFVKLAIADHGDRIGFDVIDTGIGIHENDIPYLFEAFMQVDQQRNSHIQGTGLGLGICKSIAELMGGEIHVSSVYGKGTTFSFSVPKVLGDPNLIDERNLEHERITASAAKILVVDDNEINLNVATGIFGSLGMKIDNASSGKEAIRMVRQTDYDMIFMDHMMPEMDGVETTRRIRDLGAKYATLPVVALTANAVHGAREMLLDAGMDGFVSKPIDRNELNRVIMEFLPKESYRVVTVRESDDSSKQSRASEELKKFLIEGVPDLHVSLGEARFGGNWETFVTSIKMLNRKLPGHIEKLRHLSTEETVAEYAIEVHGMKGVLAGLGCDLLAADAAKLEQAAKNGDTTFCIENTEAFTKKLKNLNEDLTKVFKRFGHPVSVAQEQGLVAELSDTLGKVTFFLDDYDTDFAATLVKKMREYRFENAIEQKLAQLEEFIEEFDYDAAKQCIAELGDLLKNSAI